MKSIRRVFLIYAVIAATFASGAQAADLTKIDRTIRREPIYRSKAPRYALLVLGPDARDRVWLVQDGETLYVDRNANGDLTDPANKVSAQPLDPETKEQVLDFEVGELHVSGRIHKRLSVSAVPLNRYAESIRERPNAKAALQADSNTPVFRVALDLDWPELRGEGGARRVRQIAGIVDGNGALLFGARPAEAPIIHLGGPLQVTFYDQTPTLKIDRTSEIVLVVGTPGLGPGTFASISYRDTIPTTAHPRIEIEFPRAASHAPPLRQSFVLKERC